MTYGECKTYGKPSKIKLFINKINNIIHPPQEKYVGMGVKIEDDWNR